MPHRGSGAKRLSSSRVPFTPRLIGSNLKNLFLGSARTREAAATADLYARARAAYARYPLADTAAWEDFITDIVSAAVAEFDPLPCKPILNALGGLVEAVVTVEGMDGLPEFADLQQLSIEESVAMRSRLWRLLRFMDDWDRLSEIWRTKLAILCHGILNELPETARGSFESKSHRNGSHSASIPLIDFCPDAATVIARTIATLYDDDVVASCLFEPIREQFERNLCTASGIPYENRGQSTKTVVGPCEYKAGSNDELVRTYVGGTPFADFFAAPVPFGIPFEVRFEHTHILAGSGHGKTQTLQQLIASDLCRDDPPSLVIVDSQGDMLRKLSKLSLFDPDGGALAGRLVMVDPSDVDHPPALNLFDVNFDRLSRYSTAAREQILNGVIELYDYIFGSLLGAELTQKQSVIFRYIARLMLTIPGATIHTLIELMGDATPFMRNIAALPPGARMFFETEFPHKSFVDTKRQIVRRLWGILENPTFERMLTAPKNRIDMFDALNTGKIILVNTAKDFLKAERSSFLGRFFIALTLQAALERAALPEEKRRPAFLYIDEAADYFDDNIDDLLTQARKYKLGVVFSHQYLDQLAPGLRSSIASNTSIKFAGGISDRDARSVAPDMRTTPTFILDRHKMARATQFACYVRNLMPAAIALTIPFGELERQATMSESAVRRLEAQNRARVSASDDRPSPRSASAESAPSASGASTSPNPSIAQADDDNWSS
jgi:hypothetical protein